MPHNSLTLGIDVGDRHSNLCLLDTETGEVIEESRIATTPQAFERRLVGVEPMRVGLEAGTHSPWISRVLGGCGHEVLVANARKLGLIYAEGRKNDRLDAENLARLARLDARLLSPIEHRGEASQAHLAIVRSREALVGARTKLVNHVRGTVKSFGARLPKCSAEGFHRKVRQHMPEALAVALDPVLETIASLRPSAYADTTAGWRPSRASSTRRPPCSGRWAASGRSRRSPSCWCWRTPPDSGGAARSAPTSGSPQGSASPGSPTRSNASPRGATSCSGSSWSRAPTTC